MHRGTVEKGTLRQTEIGDGVPVLETFKIRPVLLSGSRDDNITLHHSTKCYVAVQGLRERLGNVRLVAVDKSSIRQGNADGRHLYTSVRHVGECSAEIKQLRPFPRVLCACNLAVGAVDNCVGTISQQSAFGDFGKIQFLSHHRLHWIAPDSNDRTNRLHHISSFQGQSAFAVSARVYTQGESFSLLAFFFRTVRAKLRVHENREDHLSIAVSYSGNGAAAEDLCAQGGSPVRQHGRRRDSTG